jgi:hypothetical protein
LLPLLLLLPIDPQQARALQPWEEKAGDVTYFQDQQPFSYFVTFYS